jgi:hypothetical protein
MLSIHYLEKKGDAVYIGRQILKRRNVKNYSETNWIGGERSKSCINTKLFMPQNQASIPPVVDTQTGQSLERLQEE